MLHWNASRVVVDDVDDWEPLISIGNSTMSPKGAQLKNADELNCDVSTVRSVFILVRQWSLPESNYKFTEYAVFFWNQTDE